MENATFTFNKCFPTFSHLIGLKYFKCPIVTIRLLISDYYELYNSDWKILVYKNAKCSVLVCSKVNIHWTEAVQTLFLYHLLIGFLFGGDLILK